MFMKIIFAFLSLILLFACPISSASVNKADLANKAAFASAEISSQAISDLRALGQEGLNALLAEFDEDIAAYERIGKKSDRWQKISDAIDLVAMQKDAYASRLFWQRDLEKAKIAAKEENKPILSLRLLGNLNDEFSCANSRFFRAILYSDSAISKYLRENYILHWKSVRPAPKITVDFGDGRKIERTITGNSIHYILDDSGEIIDALPGLYSPQVFSGQLKAGFEMGRIIAGKSKNEKDLLLKNYRVVRFNEIRAKRDNALLQAKVNLIEPDEGSRAIEAAPLAMTKKTTEIAFLNALEDKFSRFTPKMTIDDWQKLAFHYANNTKFDASSRAFIKRQNPDLSNEEFSRLIANTEKYVSLDTTQNDFIFHMQIYGWINERKITDLEALNSRIYDRIFKTPDSDKWLGLYQSDIYTALDGNGIVR
jgi:hypothetical protein